jgi:hypothetical protein
MDAQQPDEILSHLPVHLRPTVERLLKTPEPMRDVVARQLLRPGAPKSLVRVISQLSGSRVA